MFESDSATGCFFYDESRYSRLELVKKGTWVHRALQIVVVRKTSVNRFRALTKILAVPNSYGSLKNSVSRHVSRYSDLTNQFTLLVQFPHRNPSSLKLHVERGKDKWTKILLEIPPGPLLLKVPASGTLLIHSLANIMISAHCESSHWYSYCEFF